ncbi:SPOR domain-containing protein [Sphingomonas sp. NPDC019816]|uniref:SPOR domain-containing protein n=1 Tax=Sphingomonas sp. NPDC019816 TaxID=3390679 RepID=UPI003D093638
MIRTLIAGTASALMLGATLTGCAADRRAARTVPAERAGADERATAALAEQTRRILAQRDGGSAVALAERLVAAEPRRAGYRALLGQSYLLAGRFASARQAFADTLQLDPADGRSALNLSLALIAGGDGEGARVVLAQHADAIPAADLGLALALAGGDGVRVLTAAVREPGATAKTRQNLALALALAGQWGMARMAASADMAPADVEARMQEWASFSTMNGPGDQVAQLLGVARAADTGQPVTLALNAAPSVVVVNDMVRGLPDAPSKGDDGRIAASPEPLAAPATRDALPGVEAAASRMVRMAPALVTTPALLRRAEERQAVHPKGEWNVQLGAFATDDGAQKAWAKLTRDHSGFTRYAPLSATVRRPEGNLYRLSIGGLTRPEADLLCRRHRDEGGECFVRAQAGDRMAHWARPGIGLAAL